ncbi:hypothetical protein Efla_007015 [Eimeria flavescens]
MRLWLLTCAVAAALPAFSRVSASVSFPTVADQELHTQCVRSTSQTGIRGPASGSRLLATAGEGECQGSSSSQDDRQPDELDLKEQSSLQLEQLLLSEADAAGLSAEELESISTARATVQELRVDVADCSLVLIHSHIQLQRREGFYQQASDLVGEEYPLPPRLLRGQTLLSEKRQHFKERQDKLKRAEARLRAVGYSAAQAVAAVCIHAKAYAADRCISSAAAAALAAAEVVSGRGLAAPGEQLLASLDASSRAALPQALQALAARADGLYRSLHERMATDTAAAVHGQIGKAKLFLDGMHQLMNAWGAAGLEQMPYVFERAIKRLQRGMELVRVRALVQQHPTLRLAADRGDSAKRREAEALSRKDEDAPGAATSNKATEQLQQLQQLLRESSTDDASGLSDVDRQRLEEATQRLHELLQETQRRRAIVKHLKSCIQSDSKALTSLMAAARAGNRPPEQALLLQSDLNYNRAWLEQAEREAASMERVLQARAGGPSQPACALLLQVQRRVAQSKPISFWKAAALVAANRVLGLPSPDWSRPQPTAKEAEGLLSILEERGQQVRTCLAALNAKSLPGAQQLKAAEQLAEEAQATSAAAEELLGPSEAVRSLKADTAELARRLPLATEEVAAASARRDLEFLLPALKQPWEQLPSVLHVVVEKRLDDLPLLNTFYIEQVRVSARAHEQARSSRVSSEEKAEFLQALQLHKSKLGLLEKAMNPLWRKSCSRLSKKVLQAMEGCRVATSRLPPAAAQPFPTGSRMLAQYKQLQSELMHKQRLSTIEKDAVRGLAVLLEAQKAAEAQVAFFGDLESLRPISASFRGAFEDLARVVSQAAAELSAGIHALTDPLEIHIASLLRRHEELERSLKHRVAGLMKQAFRINYLIYPDSQYGSNWTTVLFIERALAYVVRKAVLLVGQLKEAGVPADSLKDITSIIEKARDYGTFDV